MKKRASKKNIILFLSSAPILMTLISCQNSWTRWKISSDKSGGTFTFPEDKAISSLFYKVRNNEDLMMAYDKDAKTIDLEKINNQFELIKLMANISNLDFGTKVDQNKEVQYKVDQYYNKYKEFASRIKNIKNISLKFKYFSNTTEIIDWKAYDILSKMISPLEDPNAKEFIKVEIGDGVLPKNLTEITDNDVVKSLEKEKIIEFLKFMNLGKALKMVKLVNIPEESFKVFVEFVQSISKFFKQLVLQKVFNSWTTGKYLDFKLRDNGKKYQNLYNLLGPDTPIDEKHSYYLGALFILQNLI